MQLTFDGYQHMRQGVDIVTCHSVTHPMIIFFATINAAPLKIKKPDAKTFLPHHHERKAIASGLKIFSRL
jgi:hypothetical protein